MQNFFTNLIASLMGLKRLYTLFFAVILAFQVLFPLTGYSKSVRKYLNNFLITISSPAHTEMHKPFELVATITGSNCDISKVEFFRDKIKIGEDSIAPYNLLSSKEPIGVHYYHAKATDRCGNNIISFTKPVAVGFTSATFFRAVNLNGPSITVDNINYESSTTASDFTHSSRAFANQSVVLDPAADPGRAALIRSSLYSTKSTPASFTFNNVPMGAYEVYLYVWEDNYSQTFSIKVNGDPDGPFSLYNSGSKGEWSKIGPFKTNVYNQINIAVQGGDANISAIEIYKYDKYGSFHRAFNLNGPELTIDNLRYESSSDAPYFRHIDTRPFANQSVPLVPATDPERSKMIRSSLYATKTRTEYFIIDNIPLQFNEVHHYYFFDFDVYVYVWEDNYSQTFTIDVNYSPVTVTSGEKGAWQLVGPISVSETSVPTISIRAFGGDANISGIELWNRDMVNFYPAPTNGLQAKVRSKIYPNPLSSSSIINLPSAYTGNIRLTVEDDLGRSYLNKEVILNNEKVIPLDLSSLFLKGNLYYLKLQYGQNQEVIKLIK